MYLKVFFVLGLILVSFPSFSGVYRCIDENGVIEFRDKACENTAQEQLFLPYVYERTKQNKVNEPNEKGRKNSVKMQKLLEAEEKKRLTLETRQQKKSEKEVLKQARRALRCKNTEEKLKNIESQLHAGCKIKKMNRLKEQKAHFEIMRQRYCSVE